MVLCGTYGTVTVATCWSGNRVTNADSYIPNYHINEATFVGASEPHAVIKYDFAM